MDTIFLLVLAAIGFVGTHLLLSHALRAPLVARLGERGFLLLYSLVALLFIVWMARSYGAAHRAAPAPGWDPGEAVWAIATLLMWLASVLFVGSLRRNPAFPTGGAEPGRIGAPRGVFAITRHPMNWSFAIWALVHALVNFTPASLIVSAAIGLLAIEGSAMQDRKKAVTMGEPWREWLRATAFVPFTRGAAWPGGFALVGGTLLWLGATYAHGALGYRPAGIWHWFA